MKSERRHELQHNTLDAELGKTVQFFRRHTSTLLWAVVIFCAVLIGGNMVRKRMAARKFEQRIALAQVMNGLDARTLGPADAIQQLEDLAEQDRDEMVAIQSLVMIALLQTDHWLQLDLTPAEAAELAEDRYRQVIKRFPNHPIQVANAYIALALLAENARDFDKAAEHYRSALAVEGAGGSPAMMLAMDYSESLSQLRRPLGMTPPRMPAPTNDELGDPGTGEPPAFPLPGGPTGSEPPSVFDPVAPTEPVSPFGPDGTP